MINCNIFQDLNRSKIRVTSDGLYSVYDSISFCVENPYTIWKQLAAYNYPIGNCQWRQFPREGRKTPVASQNTIIEIIKLIDLKDREVGTKEFPTADQIWRYLEICGDINFNAFYDEFYFALMPGGSWKSVCDIKYSKELSNADKKEIMLNHSEWGIITNITGDNDFDYKLFFELMGFSDYWESSSSFVAVCQAVNEVFCDDWGKEIFQ